MEPGPQSKSDNVMTAKYRLLQSRYRAEVVEEDYGHGPHKNSKTRYGNMLINGEETGSNFISSAAFEFAKEKVQQKVFFRSEVASDTWHDENGGVGGAGGVRIKTE